MKLKNLVLNLSKDDILNLIALQDKTIIKKLDLGNTINASGIYKLVGLNIDFDTSMTISGFKNNIIYIDINNFQISGKSSSNPLVKGSIALLTKSINDIEGMNLKDKVLTIDIEKMVKAYCTDTYGIKLDKLDISTLKTSNGCFEFGINVLDINLGSLKNLNK
ncbi:MAG: hypothetical protein IJ086_15410 [Clostridium sp.]|jgi:hypothetical protein|uniref:Uncharacterized protein n=1 Tax=Clostridium saudiense TaxID=1414720 RepID=A0ABS2FIQ2_9CLOT|nr:MULTISPECIES: hypothetical protein [Clostridiaceae]MBM6820244.1 hypothetical protein [Clostridium saudiense]MBQ9000064.1 hypothetical protein [Clostridium sp.]